MNAATLVQDVMQLARPELLTVPVGVEEPRAHRDFFPGCTPAYVDAPYIPAFGPFRGAHLSLAAVVAGAVFSLEGRV